jgi:hypothetical protein
MNTDTIQAALTEAKKFVGRAQATLNAAKSDEYLLFGSKMTGALRRQSLELTRSLAEMRKR